MTAHCSVSNSYVLFSFGIKRGKAPHPTAVEICETDLNLSGLMSLKNAASIWVSALLLWHLYNLVWFVFCLYVFLFCLFSWTFSFLCSIKTVFIVTTAFERSECALLDQPRWQTEPNQTGFEKWKNTFCWQLLSTPWIHLELWSTSAGEQSVWWYATFDCWAITCWGYEIMLSVD